MVGETCQLILMLTHRIQSVTTPRPFHGILLRGRLPGPAVTGDPLIALLQLLLPHFHDLRLDLDRRPCPLEVAL